MPLLWSSLRFGYLQFYCRDITTIYGATNGIVGQDQVLVLVDTQIENA